MSVLEGRELDALAGLCAASGTVVRRTAFKECQKHGVLIEWARLLAFPEYYGKNWNAFAECLCDREMRPRAPTVFMIDDALKSCRQEGSVLLDILEQVSAGREASGYWDPSWDYPALWIVLNFSNPQHVDERVAGRSGFIRIPRV